MSPCGVASQAAPARMVRGAKSLTLRLARLLIEAPRRRVGGEGDGCTETSRDACALVVCGRVVAICGRGQGRQAMHIFGKLVALNVLPTDAQCDLAPAYQTGQHCRGVRWVSRVRCAENHVRRIFHESLYKALPAAMLAVLPSTMPT